MSNQFEHQHSHMVELADSIMQVAREGGPDGGSRLTRLRLELSRAIGKHCGAEVALINARRGTTTDRQSALIKKYHDDLLKWRHDLIACNSDWPPRRVFEKPGAFLREFGAIAIRLRERVRWEEEQFYPAVLMRAAA